MSAIMDQHVRWIEANKRLVGAATKSPVPPVYCPCCGHEVEGNAATKALALVDLPPAARKLLNILCLAYPKPVLGADIAAVLWAGMTRLPPTRGRIMSVYGHRINEAIRPYGWEVQGAYLDAGSRRLVRIRTRNGMNG